MEKRATIKDIAQNARVSIATVSRVLNNNPLVTEEMRERVLESARTLNYIPNTAAQSLKTNRTNTIGFVISDIYSEALITAAKTTEQIIAREKYNMILCSTENDPERERAYLEMLMSKNVDAIVLNTTGRNIDYVLEIDQRIPLVLFNRKIEDHRFVGDLVDSNNYHGSYQLTRQLLQQGHRRIMLVHGPIYLSNAAERFEGFAAAMREAGIDVSDGYPYIFSGDFCRETGVRAVDHLLAMEEPPTAVISQNVTMSEGILLRANALRLRIPEELSFVSYDSIPNAALMRVRPTSAASDTARMGEQIGCSVLERIKHPNLPSRSFIFEPAIEQGNSVAPPAARPPEAWQARRKRS